MKLNRKSRNLPCSVRIRCERPEHPTLVLPHQVWVEDGATGARIEGVRKVVFEAEVGKPPKATLVVVPMDPKPLDVAVPVYQVEIQWADLLP